MPGLQQEITHSIHFLTDFLLTSKDLLDDVDKVSHEIDKMRPTDEHYGKDVRKVAKKSRDRGDDATEAIKTDLQIFNREISDIISKKNNEEVIYSLTNFEIILKKCKDLRKDYTQVMKFIERKTDSSEMEKDFIKVLGYNRIVVLLYRFDEILERIISRLETLTGKK